MIRNIQILILFFAAMLSFAFPANSAKIEYETFDAPDGKYANIIRISGDIVASDFVNFQRLVNAKEEISAILFDSSPGGVLDPGLDIGRLIRKKGLTTIATGYCYSACGLAWIGGSTLIAIGNDAPGFHAAFTGDGEVSAIANALVGAYLFELGNTTNIIEFATSAKPEDIRRLSSETANLMGLRVSFVGSLQDTISYLPHFSTPIVSKQTIQVTREAPIPTKPPRTPNESSDNEMTQDAEYRLWQTALSSGDKKLFEAYLTTYPEGRYSEQARKYLESSGSDEQVAEERWYFAGFRGLDSWGGDLLSKGAEDESVDVCAELCAAKIECKLFTYNERAKTCFPKSSIDIAIKDKDAVSGLVYSAITKKGDKPPPPVVKAEFAAENGVSFTGIQLPFWQPSKSIRNINACVRYCRDSNSCSYVTFNGSQSGGQRCTVWRYRVSGIKKSRSSVSFKKISETIAPTTDIIDLGVVR